jgi:hypothetical protein
MNQNLTRFLGDYHPWTSYFSIPIGYQGWLSNPHWQHFSDYGADRCSAKVIALSEQASGMETAAFSILGMFGTQACRKLVFLQGQEMDLPKQHALWRRMASMVGWSKPVTKWCNQISSLGGLILYQSSRIISIISALRKKKLYITPFLVVNPSSDASIKNGLLLSLKHCTSYFIQDPFLNRYENHY